VDLPVIAIQWLHVGLGIVWFGASLFQALILFPALGRFPLGMQRDVGRAIGERAFVVIRPIAFAVIVLGILRGTVFGRIRGIEDLVTPYGVTWLVALGFTIGAVIWAERVIRPSLERLATMPPSEAFGPDGSGSAALVAAGDIAKRNAVLELGFFAVIFTCMILMRFGL
jgi:phosphate/sulfate permease